MKKTFLISLFLILALLISGCNREDKYNEEIPVNEIPANNQNEIEEPEKNIPYEGNDVKEFKKDIFITESGFMPNELRVKVGSEVTWSNEDTQAHIIQTKDDLFTSDSLEKGDSVTFTFDKPGTYEFFLVNKPEFTGKIIVE